MAGELYNCVNVVKELLEEIRSEGVKVVEKTHTGYPDSIVTKLEVAVVVERLRHGQAGMSNQGQRHYLLLRGYAPISGRRAKAEEELYKLWNLMIDKFNSNVTLGGTASRSNLEYGRPGYQAVAGVKCRTLDGRLEVYLLQAEAYER